MRETDVSMLEACIPHRKKAHGCLHVGSLYPHRKKAHWLATSFGGSLE